MIRRIDNGHFRRGPGTFRFVRYGSRQTFLPRYGLPSVMQGEPWLHIQRTQLALASCTAPETGAAGWQVLMQDGQL